MLSSCTQSPLLTFLFSLHRWPLALPSLCESGDFPLHLSNPGQPRLPTHPPSPRPRPFLLIIVLALFIIFLIVGRERLFAFDGRDSHGCVSKGIRASRTVAMAVTIAIDAVER